MKMKIVKITDIEMDAIASAVYTQIYILKSIGRDREAHDDIRALKRFMRKIGRKV